MRLVNVTTLKLEEFFSQIPPYAILSHTWGAEEVTFDEVQSGVDTGTGTAQSGWRKIQLACRQAHEDGFLYVWCDTCCINKSSSAELSESINSMFRWYHQAVICYVYLEDIQDIEQLADARWFTRGWTLQELIAPKRLNFYDSQWRAIGTREDLASEISLITRIDWEALHGTESLTYVRGASLAKRMAWAANRTTTREEDIAYCLIGLFDINMPLLYGEGGIKAFARLQEEIIKRGLDQSFLAWILPTDWFEMQLLPTDLDFFAGHPRCFEGCENVLITGDDVAPFSLNNKGLQIRLPIYQEKVASRSTHYIAVLACYSEDSNMKRIGIVLRAIERNGNHFIYTYSGSHRVVSNAEFQTARLQDCCILRVSARMNRHLLWVRNPVRTPIRNPALGFWLWKPETLYLDTSSSVYEWKRHKSRREFIELPDPLDPRTRGTTHGFVVTPPQSEQLPTAITDDDDEQVLKVLVRVDLGERYKANVSIQQFFEPKGLDYKDMSHVPRMRAIDVPQSRFQTTVIRSKLPTMMAASIAWKRISNQYVLILDIDINAGGKSTSWRTALTSFISWTVIKWDYHTYSFYVALLIRSQYPTILPWIVTFALLAFRLLHRPTSVQPDVRGLWDMSKNMFYLLTLALLFRDSAAVYSLLLPARVLDKHEIQLRLMLCLFSLLVDAYLANFGRVAQWMFAISVTIGLEGMLTMWAYYFPRYRYKGINMAKIHRVQHAPHEESLEGSTCKV
jgi:hypothetical protein